MCQNDIQSIVSRTQIFTTLAGDFQSNRHVLLQDIVLPEFKRTADIKDHVCQIFIDSCSHDLILQKVFL